MKKANMIGAAAALLALPVAAQAQSVSVDAGVAAYYIVEGDGFDFASSNGEGYVALSYGGVTAQIFAESVYDDPAADYNLELSLGYANELASGLSYDLTLTGYYIEDSYDDYSITLGLGYGLTDTISLGGAVEYYPDSEITDASASIEYAFSDALSAYVLLGTVDESGAGTYNYAEVGASYGFADGAAFSVLYEDADNAASTVSFILSYDFNVFGG
jgi:hypothetical protein